jgi:aryl-alcohol dehydrogenase-like predicted oxidoreductase
MMKIGLGTAQFGQHYGLSNMQGMTPAGEVREILAYAWGNGVTLLDTAPAYGLSEEVLGGAMSAHAAFTIVTKTPTFQNTKIEKEDAARIKDAFRSSLYKLRQPNLYALLVHHGTDLLKEGGQRLWEAMENVKAEGIVRKIGASVYSPAEVDALLNKYPLDIVQLPLNVFDQRMVQNGCLQYLKNQGVEIHSRSVFLQGLLLTLPNELPMHFNAIKPLMKQYYDELKTKGISPIKATLSFVYRQPNIDGIIIGINNQNHLKEIVASVANTDELNKIDFSKYALKDEAIINPSLWNIAP